MQMGSFNGNSGFSISPLPNEGPILTADELATHRTAQAAQASQQAPKRKR